MKKEKLIPKLIFFLLGMAIIQLGVVIFLLSGAGSDPFTVFTQGLSKALSVWNFCTCFSCRPYYRCNHGNIT